MAKRGGIGPRITEEERPTQAQGFFPVVEDVSTEVAQEAGELGVDVQPDKWEKWVAGAKEMWIDAPSFAIPDLLERATENMMGQIRGEAPLSVAQLKERYPDIQEAFSEPLYPEVAKLIADSSRRRKHLRLWQERGPETGFWFQLSIGATQALDPVNLALTALGGAALARFGLGSNIAAVYGENFVGNVISEIPGIVKRSQENEEPDLAELAINAAGGAIVGTALHFGVRKAADVVRRVPEAVRERNFKKILTQDEAGARLDVSEEVRNQQVRESGVNPDVPRTYVFRPVEDPKKVDFFVPTDEQSYASIEFGEREFGPGVYAVDDPAIANSIAVQRSTDGGLVRKLRPNEETRLLNLDMPVEQIPALAKEIELRSGLRLEIEDGASIGDVIESVRRAVLRGEADDIALNESIKTIRDQGYDGVLYVENPDGSSPTNRAFFFETDEIRATALGAEPANPDVVPEPRPKSNEEAIAELEAPENQDLTVPNKLAEIRESLAKARAIESNPEHAAEIEETYKQLVKERVESDPELKELVEEYDAEVRAEEAQIEAHEFLSNCMAKRMT